jgi:hypothetical protein
MPSYAQPMLAVTDTFGYGDCGYGDCGYDYGGYGY